MGMRRWIRRCGRACASGALALLASAAVAQGAPWHLDPSFGRGGIAVLPQDAPGEALVAGGKGSLLVAAEPYFEKGAPYLASISATGKSVTGFGSDGMLQLADESALNVDTLDRLADGDVLIVGTGTEDQLVLVRVTSAGTLDPSFGHDGVVSHKLPSILIASIIAAVDVEADGDVVIAYEEELREITFGEGPLQLLRLLPSGALDTSFGRGGHLTATGALDPGSLFGGEALQLTRNGIAEVAFASDGSLLLGYERVAGATSTAQVPSVQALGPTGLPEADFGRDGLAVLPRPPGASSAIVGLLPLAGGGAEVAVGGEEGDGHHVGELIRLSASGAIDHAFGVDGVAPIGHQVSAVAMGPHGETFAVGRSGGALLVSGMLADGRADRALGGSAGLRLALDLPQRDPSEPSRIFVLPKANELSVLDGGRIVRLER